MTINFGGLGINKTEENVKNRTEGSSVISQTYNLLSESVNVHWNGESLILNAPSGLTTISQIAFRSFEGENLPYLSLDLPDLNISLRIVVSDNFDSSMYSIYLVGNDNSLNIDPFHEIKQEQKNKDTSNNIITSFNKAWTYDSLADSQIEYNISELVDYMNEVLMSWFGPLSNKLYFGMDNENNWISYDLPYDGSNSENVDGDLVINSSYNKYYIPSVNASNEFVLSDVITISIGSHGNRHSSYYNGMLLVYDGNKYWHDCAYYDKITNKSINLWSYIGNPALDTRLYNYGDLAHGYTENFVVILPFEEWSTDPNTFRVIKRGTSSIMSKTFEATTYYKHYIVCGINTISDTAIKVYTLAAVDSSSTALCLVPFTIYFNDDITSIETCTMVTNEIINNIITIDEYKRQNMYELNDGLVFENMTNCEYGANHYLCFDGKVIIRIDGDMSDGNPNVRYLRTYKIQQEGEIFYVSQQQEAEYGNFDGIHMSKISASSLVLPANVDYALRKGHYPHHNDYLDNSSPIVKITSETGINVYYQNGKVCNTIQRYYFPNFECYYSSNGTNQYPINSIDNHISFNGDLFKYENGTLSFPSIVWSDTSFITFIPIVTTSPIYFNVKYNIPKSIDLGDYSITLTDSSVELLTLNSHVLDTLEMLIIQKYEYVSLMFKCYNFPNSDNVVFALGEIARVQFKVMNINGTNMSLMCGVVDNNGEGLTLNELKRVYGKLVVNIDFYI